jgi:hypothetical protein
MTAYPLASPVYVTYTRLVEVLRAKLTVLSDRQALLHDDTGMMAPLEQRVLTQNH